jgi:hypothetical protein
VRVSLSVAPPHQHLQLVHATPPGLCPVDRTNDSHERPGPFAPPPLRGLHHYYGPVRRRVLQRYSRPREQEDPSPSGERWRPTWRRPATAGSPTASAPIASGRWWAEGSRTARRAMATSTRAQPAMGEPCEFAHAAAWRLLRTTTSGDGIASTDCRPRARRRAGPHRDPSTCRAVRPRHPCTRSSSTTWRRSSPKRPKRTAWARACPRGSSATSAATFECGILAYGFARARCEECGHERVIPLMQGPGRLPLL